MKPYWKDLLDKWERQREIDNFGRQTGVWLSCEEYSSHYFFVSLYHALHGRGITKNSAGLVNYGFGCILVQFILACESICFSRSSSLGTFCKEECLRLSNRNSILMTQINVYIINLVVMGFQM